MNNAHPLDAGFHQKTDRFCSANDKLNLRYDTLRRNGRTTMVRKNTMNGRHAKRQNCSLQTTRGNCERGRDNDGLQRVMKQYYARMITHRLAGDGATIFIYFVFSCGPRSARGFCEPGSEPAHIFSSSGTHYAHDLLKDISAEKIISS